MNFYHLLLNKKNSWFFCLQGWFDFSLILDWIFMAKFAAVVMKLPCKFLNLFVVHKKGDGPCFHCSCEPLECCIVYLIVVSGRWVVFDLTAEKSKDWCEKSLGISIRHFHSHLKICFHHTKQVESMTLSITCKILQRVWV